MWNSENTSFNTAILFYFYLIYSYQLKLLVHTDAESKLTTKLKRSEYENYLSPSYPFCIHSKCNTVACSRPTVTVIATVTVTVNTIKRWSDAVDLFVYSSNLDIVLVVMKGNESEVLLLLHRSCLFPTTVYPLYTFLSKTLPKFVQDCGLRSNTHTFPESNIEPNYWIHTPPPRSVVLLKRRRIWGLSVNTVASES